MVTFALFLAIIPIPCLDLGTVMRMSNGSHCSAAV